MDQSNQAPDSGNQSAPLPDEASGGAGGKTNAGGSGGLPPPPPRDTGTAAGSEDAGGENPPSPSGDRIGDAPGEGKQPAGKRGPVPPPQNAPKTRGRTAYEISRALNEAGGDRALAAAALGISGEQLAIRIRTNQQLRALWGKVGADDAAGPPVPREGEVLNRSPVGLPAAAPGDIELLEMVTQAERQLHHHGLKNLGVSEKVLKRLKGLEGLATSTGHFIAHSLEVTARSYYVQILEMMEMAHDLRAKLMIPAGQEGYISNDETRAFFNKNYIEFVKEAGRAFELMLQAAQAMVKMMLDSKALESPDGTGSRKPKWTQIQSDKKSDAQDRPQDI